MKDEDILKLEKVLVKDNVNIKKIRVEWGTRGAGGSNDSGYSEDYSIVYGVDELNNKSFPSFSPFSYCRWEEKVYIYAIIEDVVYIVLESTYNGEKTVYKFSIDKYYRKIDTVSYDTYGMFYVLIEK